MENYSFLRELADSWGLLVLFTFFVGMVLWVLRPGSRAAHRDCAAIPLRHDDKPAAAEDKEART
ncbi:cbb3-type cytochrome c oxidase subunit 3 [Marinovum sp. SP66]|uniref:cbb3-type cytochrome oxidase subunit 3 n=1 Tax=Marinovum TaxID=367771 RepID=UPI00237B33CE|nr:cbb3-type cytochrome c oxidase subunit 3 [Marinovum sp. SP66]MDD9741120.1 cbb3-type cytochrome c oxidase subunit 3 [Marinovum sp. SP66]